MTNLIKFPRERKDPPRADSNAFGGPFDRLEAVNGNPDWTLYLVNGRTGEYREIAKAVDKTAIDLLFAHIEGIHRAWQEARYERGPNDDPGDFAF